MITREQIEAVRNDAIERVALANEHGESYLVGYANARTTVAITDIALRALDMEAEVARLREAMPSEEELRLCMECVSEADHLHTHWDVVDGWLDRIEKARGG